MLKQTTPPHSTDHAHAASLAQPPRCWFLGTPCPPPNWSLSFPERQNVFLRVAMGHECKHCFSSARTTQCDTIQISFKNFLKGNCHLVLAFGACHQCFGLDFTACSPGFHHVSSNFRPVLTRHHLKFNQVSSVFIRFLHVFACSAFSANFSPSFEVWHKLMFTKFSANFLQVPQEKPTKNVHWEGLLASCYKEGQLASNLDRWKLTQKSPCTHCILALVLRLTELTMKLFAFGRYTACILAVLHRKLELAATGSAKPLVGNPSGPLKLQGQPSNNVKDLISNFVGFQVGSSAPV